MRLYYIIIDGEVTHTDDINLWSKNLDNNRKIKQDTFEGDIPEDNVTISTVFLGLDHSHGGLIPVLFETMVFGGEFDQYQNRYHTKEEAIIGHQEIFDKIDRGRIKRDNKLKDLGI